jgi:hypothetical protein
VTKDVNKDGKKTDVARSSRNGSKRFRATGTSFRVRLSHTPDTYSIRHVHDGHIEIRPKDSLEVFPAVNGKVSIHHSAPGGDKSRHGYLGHFRVKESTWQHMCKHMRPESSDKANDGPANDNQQHDGPYNSHKYIEKHLQAVHHYAHLAQRAYQAGKKSEGDAHMQKVFDHNGSAAYHNGAANFGKNKGESV